MSGTFHVGYLCYKGKGVIKDLKRAYECFKKLDEVNWKPAYGQIKGFLAEMYYYGNYVTKDYDMAFKLAKEGAEHINDPSGIAMRILSACYRYGLGTSVDNDKAERWLKEAANYNEDKALKALGMESMVFSFE